MLALQVVPVFTRIKDCPMGFGMRTEAVSIEQFDQRASRTTLMIPRWRNMLLPSTGKKRPVSTKPQSKSSE